MAGDWIKMRLDLQTHPKVVRILSATKSDKFRVIGGLHAVWSVFDTHSTDGRLAGYTPETLDHIIGWQGFASAMIAVGWLGYDGAETLILPEFDEHNGKSGKRRAEDQKRKRNDRKSPQSVRNLSADKPDAERTREEKRREEKEETKNNSAGALPCDVAIERRQANLEAIEEQLDAEVAAVQTIQAAVGPAEPDDKPTRFEGKRALMAEGVGDQLATDFIKLRTAKRAPLSQSALDGLKREAAKAGLSVADAVLVCCERGWQSLKADWLAPRANATAPNRANGRPSINAPFAPGADDDIFNQLRRELP